jgi:hypothetical protein
MEKIVKLSQLSGGQYEIDVLGVKFMGDSANEDDYNLELANYLSDKIESLIISFVQDLNDPNISLAQDSYNQIIKSLSKE